MEYSQKKATGKNRIYICVRLFLLSRLMFYFASASPLGISSNKGVSKCICSNPWCAAVAAQIQHMQHLQLHLNRTAPVLISRKCNICLRHIFREPFSVFVFVFVCRHESSNTTSSLAATSPQTHNERVLLFSSLCCFLYLCLSLLLSMQYASAQIKHLPNTQPNIWTFEQLQALLYYKLCLFKNTYKSMFHLRWSVSVCNFVCY